MQAARELETEIGEFQFPFHRDGHCNNTNQSPIVHKYRDFQFPFCWDSHFNSDLKVTKLNISFELDGPSSICAFASPAARNWYQSEPGMPGERASICCQVKIQRRKSSLPAVQDHDNRIR
jgi:hypothetical protein